MSEVQLRVADMPQRDVGRGIVRIDQQTMQRLGINANDIIEITKKRATSAIVWPAYEEDESRNMIRVDDFTRKNCGVAIDEYVTARPAKVKTALSITLAPVEMRLNVDEDFINFVRNRLKDTTIVEGDITLLMMLGARIPFTALKTDPDGIVKITAESHIIIYNDPLNNSDKIIEIEAESLEKAREQAKSLKTDRLNLLSEQIVSEGKPKTVTADGDTTELAYAGAQGEIPTTADVTERKVRTAPMQKIIKIEAFDEQNARSIAKEQSISQLGEAATVQSIMMVKAGNKGFLGISKKPNQYEAKITRRAVVEVSYKPKVKIYVRMRLNYAAGLRPLGNKKRLTQTTSNYDARLLLFRDKGSAEKYYDLFTGYARNNPPPHLIEAMLLFIPKSIFAEKYAVVIPNENTESRPGYKEWAKNAIWSCNDTLRIHSSTDHEYKELHQYVEIVYTWDILVPKNFSETSSEAKELLCDDPNEGFPSLKVLGQIGVTPPPETPEPHGPWVGVLFEINSFEEAFYGRAATTQLFEIVGNQQLASCIIHGGDILPECRYWCSAIHTSSIDQAQHIKRAIETSSEKHLAPAGSRLLSGSEVPVRTLPYQGFVSKDGSYIGSLSPLSGSQISKKSTETQSRSVALIGHVGCVRAIGASANGSIIATGSYDGSVCLWDPATGRQVGKFNVESDIGTLAMSSDGTQVIIGCNSNFIEVWEVGTGRRLSQMKGHKRFPCSSMDCSKDNRWAASASWGEPGIFLWNLETGILERQIVPEGSFRPIAVSVSFSPDSTKLAIGDAEGVFVCEVPSGKLVARLAGHPGARCNFVKFLNDDAVASIGADGDVKIQSVSQKAMLRQRRIETRGTVNAGAVSDDGKYIAIGEFDGTINEWNLETGLIVIKRTRAHGNNQIMAMMYVPRTHTYVSCDTSGMVNLWNPTSPDAVLATPRVKTPMERIQELETFLKQRPNWAEGHDQLAREYWDQGDAVNMFRQFYAAAQADPSSNQPHKYLKEVYYGMARFEDFRREDTADRATDSRGPGGTVLVPQLRAQIRKLAIERKIELEKVIREFQS